MKLIHEKSKCCAVKIVRFGGKRRRCVKCGTTWRVHPAKRGRKSLRKQKKYLHKVFCQGFSVKQIAVNSKLSVDAIYKRFHNNLNQAVSKKRIIRIKGKKLILIIDGLWQFFDNELWTLYCLAIKSSTSKRATLLDPVLKKGKENTWDWDYLIDQLPKGIKKRVVAMVSDGLRGIDTIAEWRNWIHQRCHFHLISSLQRLRGKRANTHGKLVREEIYHLTKSALVETSSRKLNKICQRLMLLTINPLCPKKMRAIVREFLKRLPDFRNYLEYPELNLPTTINVVESANNLIRGKSKTIHSPQAWQKWAIAIARFKSIFTCK